MGGQTDGDENEDASFRQAERDWKGQGRGRARQVEGDVFSDPE